jgi:hypothetical protein
MFTWQGLQTEAYTAVLQLVTLMQHPDSAAERALTNCGRQTQTQCHFVGQHKGYSCHWYPKYMTKQDVDSHTYHEK